MTQTEIYVSTDVETDGPIPGPNSMLSLASAAYASDKTLLGIFAVNLEPLAGAQPDPKTEAWWRSQPEAWAACRVAPEPAQSALPRYVAWLKKLPGRPVFVAYPAGFDFTFVYWYLMRFAGESPFGHQALDIKSFAMAYLQLEFRRTTKRHMPARWFEQRAHTHVAIDDALEQGVLFCNLLRDSRSR